MSGTIGHFMASDPDDPTGFSHGFLGGRLTLEQPKQGYRFSIDAPILAAHIHTQKKDVALELGTGCGIISLLVAFRHPTIRIYAVEIQPELSGMARKNIDANQMEQIVTLICKDMKAVSLADVGQPVDLVFCNPPYRRPSEGRLSGDRQRAIARHELLISLPELLKVASCCLKNGGRFITIYLAERLPELLSRLSASAMEPKKLRVVHSRPDTDAKLCIVEAVKGAGKGLRILPPLVIYEPSGAYTKEVARMLVP